MPLFVAYGKDMGLITTRSQGSSSVQVVKDCVLAAKMINVLVPAPSVFVLYTIIVCSVQHMHSLVFHTAPELSLL